MRVNAIWLRESENPRKGLQAKSMEVIIVNDVDESSLSFNLSPKGHVNEQLESGGMTNNSTILQWDATVPVSVTFSTSTTCVTQ